MKKNQPDLPSDQFPIVGKLDLDKMAQGTCTCCGSEFNEFMRPDITAKCHQGPVFVSYWYGWLHIACGKCRKPILRVRVSQEKEGQ